jgi:hypothetical protein
VHCVLYEFFRDQGSIIAGALALIAGGIAYLAGHVQATATRQAAEMQVAARDAEIKSADAAAANAIGREIIECSKVVIEALRICECIKVGEVEIIRKNAHSIMINPDPIVYRAVAGRIDHLPYDPQLVVSFYMRMVYVQESIEIIVVGSPGDDSAPVPGEEAETIAKNLKVVCQLARAIISHVPGPIADKQVAHIDAALERAERTFPQGDQTASAAEADQGSRKLK